MANLTNAYQVAAQEILQNYPNRFIALKLRWLMFPLGKPYHPPSDQLDTKIANLFTTNTDVRQRYLKDVFAENTAANPAGQANHVFLQYDQLKPLFKKIIDGVRAGTIPKVTGATQITLAKEAGLLTAAEAKKLLSYDRQLMGVIHVDHFAEKELVRVKPVAKKAAAKKK
jgi:hypothetical protein